MNKTFWDSYYAKGLGMQEPTSFAKSVGESIPSGSSILELGCGNGRDSFYFAGLGHRVFSVDQSEVVISKIRRDNANPTFFCEDVLSLHNFPESSVDIGYARFFLHALDEAEADKAVQCMRRVLSPGGLFFSESRSIKSTLYGIGTASNHDTFETDHKRRFLRREELIQQLERYGFLIETVVEAAGLAVYQDDDPVVIRVSARKMPA